MKFLFNLLVSMWDVTEFAVANWIILGLMAPVVFVFAFRITGEAAFFLGYNSKIMSFFHWVIRLIIYIVAVYLLKGVIWIFAQPLVIFKVDNPRFISSIIVALFMLGFAIFIKIKSNMNYRVFWP